MNTSGLKSLDKIAASPKVEKITREVDDIVIYLNPGFTTESGDTVLRAKDIKTTWHLFRHGIFGSSSGASALQPVSTAAAENEGPSQTRPETSEPNLMKALKTIAGVDFTGLKGKPEDFVVGAPLKDCTGFDHIYADGERILGETRCLCGQAIWGTVLKR